MKSLKEILEGRNIGNFTLAYNVPEGSVEEMFDLLKAEVIDPKKYRKINGNEWKQRMNISDEAQSFSNMLSEIGLSIDRRDQFMDLDLSIIHKYNPWEEETKWIWRFSVSVGSDVTIESPANEQLTIKSFIKKYVEPIFKDFKTFKEFANDKSNLK